MNRTSTETVRTLLDQQAIVPEWMREITKGLADTDLVEVTRKHTPFGTYVMNVRPASEVTA